MCSCSRRGLYEIRELKAPEGYGFDPDFKFYTGRVYGEWLLRIRRNGDAPDAAQ